MQKFIPPILGSIILALWVSIIAILSVQNATPISLKFIGFHSIKIPLGVILSFSLSLGVLISAIFMAPLLRIGQIKDRQEDF